MPSDYVPISQVVCDTDAKEFFFPVQRTSLSTRWKYGLFILGISLVGSICANIFLIYRQFFRPWELNNELPSQFAGLRRDKPTETVSSNNYDSMNRTVQDAAWDHVDLEPWNGFLALDEDYAIAQGLPHSQRWPWDSSKGVYILTSSHELHCVRILRSFVNEDHDGVPKSAQTWPYYHLMHCLNVLRDTVMCNADDTPLYIGRLHKNIHEKTPRAGTGTMKMCRDWDKLLTWSRARSACYQPVHFGEPGFSEIDRYKSCPDGARPWEKVEDVES